MAVLLAAAGAATGAEVPRELRGRVSAEVTSCEPFRAAANTRVVLVRVRAGARGVRNPEVRCAAVARGSEEALAWAPVHGLDQIEPNEVREAMVLVAADAVHGECRCVVGEAREDAACLPWQSFENGRCVEPVDVAAPPPPAPGDELSGALRVSRALGPLREQAGDGAGGPALCAAVPPAALAELVFALVPEDDTVYVRSLWHRLDEADRRAFAAWARQCFEVERIVDAERGVELERGGAAPPANER